MKTEETPRKTWERTKIRGLLRHKGGRYYGRFTLGGKTEFVPLETNVLEIARTRFAKHKAKVEGLRKAARSAEQGTARMSELYELYTNRVNERQGISDATRERYAESASFIPKTWPEFLALRPDEITRTAVDTWKNRALKDGTGHRPPGSDPEKTPTGGRSPSSFNKAVDALRSMLDLAVEMGALHANPLKVRGVKAKHRPHKPDLPTTDILQAIFADIEAQGGKGREIADFCRFLAFTGCRLREAAGVTWADVNFERGTIRIRGTKTDAAAREVPMIPAAKALLERINERRKKAATVAVDGVPHVDPKSRVIGVAEGGKALANACQRAGVNNLTHHDLRDAFATQAIESGVDIPTVAAWLGHVDGGALLMRTYAHHRRPHSIAQAAKVNFGGIL